MPFISFAISDMSGPVKPVVVPVTVFLVIVSVGVVATWPSGPVEAEYYQRFQDGKSLHALLGSRIDCGDPLQKVKQILGRGVTLEEVEDDEPLRDYLWREASLNPKSFPDEVQPGDVFVRYSHGDEPHHTAVPQRLSG